MATFPIVNPIGMSPIFLSFTKYYSPLRRRYMARKIAIYSFFIYIVTLIAGSWILSFFSLSIPIIKIAGGLIIYFSALGMLQRKPKLSDKEQQETLQNSNDVLFFPLTMPITAGAGSMAIVMAIGAGIVNNGVFSVQAISELLGAALGILLLSFTVFICYYFADRIFAKLGTVGTDVVTQLAAFILLAVSIEVMWEGLKVLLLT
jgi:multiple antibiotic resistance protein